MKIEELPQFLRFLEAQHGFFDPLLIMYHTVFRTGYLHFGFWPEEKGNDADLEALLDNSRSAQARYADELLTCLPQGPHRVLDVGAGLGKFSGRLIQHGHSVTAVTPCAYQAQQIADHYPEVRVKHGRFQEVGQTLPPASFDIILFSESFRYMPLTQVFSLLNRLLSQDGHVVIADWFAYNTSVTRRGHDHNLRVFRNAARENGLGIVSERDVTTNVLPTVKLGYDILCELYLPLAAFVLAKFAQKRPRLFRLCLRWIMKWLENRILPHVPGRFDPTVFAEQYRYFFFVLRRTNLAPVTEGGAPSGN